MDNGQNEEFVATQNDRNSQRFEFEDSRVLKHKDSWFLYFAVFTACMPMFGVGTIMVWLSTLIPKLINNTEITMKVISWYMWAFSLGTIIGPLLMGILLDIIGRKNSLTICFSIIIFCYIQVAFSESVILYIISQIACALCLGFLLQALPIFLTEITEDHNRARFGCLISIFVPLGSMYSSLLNPLSSSKLFTVLLAAPMLASFILFVVFVPESSTYLASKGDKSGAKKSIEKYRNKTAMEIDIDLEAIEHMLRESSKYHVGGYRSIFKTRSSRKGFLVALCINIIPAISGINVIMMYAIPIVYEADIIENYLVIFKVILIPQVVATLITAAIVEKVGRRPLLLISSLGAAASMLIFGLYFFLRDAEYITSHYISWMSLMALFSWLVFNGLGIGCIPLAIMSEMFPSNIRSAAISLVVFTGLLMANLINHFLFPIMARLTDPYYCMFAFTNALLAGAAFIYIVVPETKGKSVLEIQEILG